MYVFVCMGVGSHVCVMFACKHVKSKDRVSLGVEHLSVFDIDIG